MKTKHFTGLILLLLMALLTKLPQAEADADLESYSPYYGLATTAKKFGSKQSDCVRKLSRIEEAIRHKEVWALKLMDASGTPKTGFYWGNTYWLGSRAQCITAHSGKEPMIDKDLPPVTRETKETITPFPVDYYVAYFYHNSKMQMFVHWPNETKISLGLCLPSSCTKNEVSDLLQKYFDTGKLSHQQLFNTSLIVEETKKTEVKIDLEHPGTIILLVWALSAVVLCIFGTIYDTYIYSPVSCELAETKINGRAGNGTNGFQTTNGYYTATEKSPVPTTWQEILLSFSWHRNFKTIFTTQVKKDSLVPIMGLRFLLTNFIIFGHSYVFLMDYLSDRTAIYMYSGNAIGQIFQNSAYGVDTFFMLGGFLAIYTLSKSKNLKDEAQHTNWGLLKIFFRSVFKRFKRLTPVYLFVMLMVFNQTLFRERLCSFWTNERNDVQCAQFWWTNLLYINNVYPGTFDSMCMSWSWYLACDMQFFVITSFLYILSKKNPKLGAILALGTFIGCLLALGVITYVTGYKPFIDQFYQSAPIVYYPPWSRINSYLVGALYAFIFVKTNGKLEIEKIYIRILWSISVCLFVYLEYGFADKNFTPLRAVLHTALHRPAFAAAAGWVVFACLTGHGGFINSVLCATGWRPFSHLTYAAYLTNPLIMYALVTSTDGAWQFNDAIILLIGNGLIVVTYMLSLVLVLTIEMPFDNLLNLIFGDTQRLKKEVRQCGANEQLVNGKKNR